MGRKRSALLLGTKANLSYVYPEYLREEISELVDWACPPIELTRWDVDAADLSVPPQTEIIFSTWGMPPLDEAFLKRLPNLQAVCYAAGSVRGFVTDASWRRGVRIFSAAQANAVPVAEFTVAEIILGLKQVHRLGVRAAADWAHATAVKNCMRGNYRSRVGLISYGAIARLVRQILKSFDHEVWVYDPNLSRHEAEREGVELVGLEQLFRDCHAVSLHAPLLDATHGMIRGHHFASMRENALFINTARGAIVNQPEMVEVLRARPDLLAIIDVVEPEPPLEGEPLLGLPNAFVTPHLAGSMGHERARMGTYILEAYTDFLSGRPTSLEVKASDMAWIA